MALQPQRTRVSFPVEPIRIPAYSNSVLVNLINGDFLIDFGFIDPYAIEIAKQNSKPENSETESDIDVLSVPLVRVVLNKQTVENLIAQLRERLDLMEE